MRRHLFLPILLLCGLAVVGAVYFYGQRHFTGMVTSVASGDTLTVFYNQTHRAIRLSGITAPQEGMPFFAEVRGAERGRIYFLL
jgi:endonuclease YncB( thermonuclease family)